jgi:hypothetical protein
MEPFERRMLIATWVGIAIGVITGLVFIGQFWQMKTQTRILSEQAKQAAADSLVSENHTREQLRIASDQTKAAVDTAKAVTDYLFLQQEINSPQVNVDLMSIYHQKNGQVRVDIRIRNYGQTPARDLRGAVAWRFGVSPPPRKQRKFVSFDPLTPDYLLAHNPSNLQEAWSINHVGKVPPENYAIYKAQNENLYVWGEIYYRDAPQPFRFCRYGAAKAVLDTSEGESKEFGYHGLPPYDCDQPQ